MAHGIDVTFERPSLLVAPSSDGLISPHDVVSSSTREQRLVTNPIRVFMVLTFHR
jgi:hypothetical protein